MDYKINEILTKINVIKAGNTNLSPILNIFVYYLKMKIINMIKIIIYYEKIINDLETDHDNNNNINLLENLKQLIRLRI